MLLLLDRVRVAVSPSFIVVVVAYLTVRHDSGIDLFVSLQRSARKHIYIRVNKV